MYHTPRFSLLFIFLLLGLGVTAQNDTTTTPELTPKHVSYAYGYSFAEDLADNERFSKEERQSKYLLKGLKDGLYKLDTAKLNQVTDVLIARIDADSPATNTKVAYNTAYNLGYNAMGNLVNLLQLSKKDFHYGWLKKGFYDFEKGKTARFDNDQRTALLSNFFKEKQAIVQERYEKERQLLAEKNLKEAEAFMAENGKKANIQTTLSGLQYQIIKEGTGAQPAVNDRVKVHYTGTFVDGQVFDSSIERGEPATFSLSGVIQGWQEGIPMMKSGARYRFFVPPNLGYGISSPPSIPPNAVLIFDVDLVEVLSDTGLFTTKGAMSYSYGYMLSNSLSNLGFSPAERAVGPFVEGYAAGFELDKVAFGQVEEAMKARLQTQQAVSSPKEAQQIAHNIGVVSSGSIAQQMGARLADFSLPALARGYQDAIDQADPQFTQQEMQDAVNAYFEPKQQAAMQRKKAQNAAQAAGNKEKAQAFLTENAKKEGIITLPSGLQYKVLQAGTGEQPTASSTVTTHYTGMLQDGSVFDSSVKRGEPATFRLNQVIQGWQEGIPLMKKGAKYRFFIPSDLGYGDQGMGDSIPPGALLIFEVELLKVE